MTQGYPLLRDVRVLEVAQLAPSSVGGHLADLGADVIKVESGLGDGVRGSGSWAVGSPDGPGFLHLRWNRGKRSVHLDLRSEGGKADFVALAAKSHVVIEGTRAGYLEHLGLGPDRLRQDNPALVFCTISGFGSSGPLHRLGSGGPAFDGYAGLRQVELPDTPPTQGMGGGAAPTIAMYALGAHGALAVLAALHDAHRTGRGRTVEVAGVDVAASWVPDQIDAALNRDRIVPRGSWLPDGRLPDWPRVEAYTTKDGGAVLFGAHVEKFWSSFCRAVGREDLLDIDVSSVGEGAEDRADELWRELRDLFQTRTRSEWTALFLEHDIAGAPVHTVDELVHDPHYRSRPNTFSLLTRAHGTVELTASVIRVTGERFTTTEPPMLGEHTDEVLSSLAPQPSEELNLEGAR